MSSMTTNMSAANSGVSKDYRMADQADKRPDDSLPRLERDLDNLIQGLGLLGVKPCSWCRKFFQSSDGSALLIWENELVCSTCIPQWLPQRHAQLSAKDQGRLERKLVTWLRRHHHAKVLPQVSEQPENALGVFWFTATCHECSGSGTIIDESCGYCGGRGTVWVVTPKKEIF